ncbi:hypothetical protein OUZ56_003866 [Daphnia magna]|uniref:Distal membrane-arm assembly complex protein 1-like domain-containing protein n=1 Tax=Daphnia magna TaxID=35525 RepID=A0ABQ9YN48_9CRUS|nr:hypothetical protein OUZ56_003866 [Daphnia magna]
MDRDCLGCRLISGSGLIGAAAYIAHHSNKSKHKWSRVSMQMISIGFASVGSARLLNIYPFNITHKSQH